MDLHSVGAESFEDDLNVRVYPICPPRLRFKLRVHEATALPSPMTYYYLGTVCPQRRTVTEKSVY